MIIDVLYISTTKKLAFCFTTDDDDDEEEEEEGDDNDDDDVGFSSL